MAMLRDTDDRTPWADDGAIRELNADELDTVSGGAVFAGESDYQEGTVIITTGEYTYMVFEV